MTHSKQFKACLFDMDGLLINSEDVYTESFSKVLRENFGVESGLTWDVKVQLQGLQGPMACQVVVDAYHLGNVTDNMEILRLTSKEQEKLWPKVRFLPGALELLRRLHSEGVPIALCTSSTTEKFHLKSGHLQEGFSLFEGRIITGDNPEIAGRGKPQPYVWWAGLELINKGRETNIKPEECLVFEDAIPGVISGKRAGCYVVWVPDVHAVEVMSKKRIAELAGENSQHAILLDSLEKFDAGEYGL